MKGVGPAECSQSLRGSWRPSLGPCCCLCRLRPSQFQSSQMLLRSWRVAHPMMLPLALPASSTAMSWTMCARAGTASCGAPPFKAGAASGCSGTAMGAAYTSSMMSPGRVASCIATSESILLQPMPLPPGTNVVAATAATAAAKADDKSNRGCNHVPRRRATNLIVASPRVMSAAVMLRLMP